MNIIDEIIYEYISLIPLGKVSTFKELARVCCKDKKIGIIMSAIKKCTDNKIPAHRIVSSSGKLTNIYHEGKKEQKEKLQMEGVFIKKNRVDLEKYMFYFY